MSHDSVTRIDSCEKILSLKNCQNEPDEDKVLVKLVNSY